MMNMKGSLDKSYDCSIIIDDEQLRYISDFIKERFNEVRYEIKTLDGAVYKLDSIDAILSYNNPDARRLIKVSIIGNKECGTHIFLPDITVSLFDMSKYDKSCVISLNNLDEQEITFISQRIDEFVEGARMPYWWIHKNAVYWILGVSLYCVLAILYYVKLGKEQFDKSMSNTFFWLGVSIICMFFSTVIVKRSIEYLFPEGGFAIGEQVKFMKKKNKTRSIILGLLLSVITGLIVYWITT